MTLGERLPMSNIEISGLTHQYVDTNGQLITAIDNVSLAVSNGRFMSIVGPSGCGKTTLLTIVTGFVRQRERPERNNRVSLSSRRYCGVTATPNSAAASMSHS